jgi:hypothetical protein
MFQKYGGKEPTLSLSTEPPFYEFEEPTTMKIHRKEHTHVPVTKTTQATLTSATTKSRLSRLVALETTEAIKPTNFTTSPAAAATTTTTAAATATTTATAATTATTTSATTTAATERPLPQQEGSTYFSTDTPASSTENYLKQQLMFISSAATTEKSLTQSKQHDMTTTITIRSPLIRLVEQITTMPTTPVTSLDTEHPLTTPTEESSTEMEETSANESGQVTRTQAKQMEYTVPHVEKSEQPSLTSSDIPIHWQLGATTSMLTTDLPDTTQHLEYKTTPNLVKPGPETASTTEYRLLKYKITDFVHSAGHTEMAFMTESSQPEDQSTRQHLIHWLIHGKLSTDTATNPTLHVGTDSSTLFTEPVTTIFERDGISDHSEPKTDTTKQLASSSGSSVTETEDPVKNFTTPVTKFSKNISTTDSMSVNNQSVFTTKTESTTSHISTAAINLTTIDRSTAPYTSTVNITDMESTTPMNLLTSSSSSHPHIQPIYTLVTMDTSTAFADSTTITSAMGSTAATDSSVSEIDDLSSQSISAVQVTDVSRILSTTDGPLHMSVTGPTAGAVTNSAVSTLHSSTAGDETLVMSPSYKSQKIIANATVAPG